jgi:hypothetical protein
MSKILVFIVTVPFLCLLLYKAVFFYEYDTKQRYLKDLVDDAAFKVRLTGILTREEHDELAQKLLRLGIDTGSGSGIIIKKGSFSDGELAALTDYTPGEYLQRGDAFMLTVISVNPSKLSVVFGRDGSEGGDELYFKAKALCRVEYGGG